MEVFRKRLGEYLVATTREILGRNDLDGTKDCVVFVVYVREPRKRLFRFSASTPLIKGGFVGMLENGIPVVKDIAGHTVNLKRLNWCRWFIGEDPLCYPRRKLGV